MSSTLVAVGNDLLAASESTLNNDDSFVGLFVYGGGDYPSPPNAMAQAQIMQSTDKHQWIVFTDSNERDDDVPCACVEPLTDCDARNVRYFVSLVCVQKQK